MKRNFFKTEQKKDGTQMKKRNIAIALLGSFLLSRCEVIGGIYPFAGALLCALTPSRSFYLIILGSVLGAASISSEINTVLLNLIPLVMLVPAALTVKRAGIKKLWPLQAAVLLTHVVTALLYKAALLEKITVIFGGLMAACLAPVVKRLYISFTEIENRLSLEKADILAISCVGVLAVSSMPKTDFFGINLCVAALLATSCLAVCAFEYSSCIWTSLCAVLWVIKGGDACIGLCLVSGGVLASMLSNFRGGILLGFLTGDMLISLFYLNTPQISMGLINVILGCAYTIFLSQNNMDKLKRLAGLRSGVNDLEMNYIEGLRQQQREKLLGASVMYKELSKAFAVASLKGEFRRALAQNALKICHECKKKEYCLKSRKSDTVLEINSACDSIIENGAECLLPTLLAARCVQQGVLKSGIEQAYFSLKDAYAENPDSGFELAQQLENISKMLYSLSEDLNRLPQFDKEKELEIKNVLSSRIKGLKQVLCRKSGESHIVTVTFKENTKQLPQKICEALEKGFVGKYKYISGGTNASGGFTGTFAPEAKFNIKAYACRQNKKGQSVCGDSFSFNNTANDKYIAAVCDGAGSGERAKKESESTLDLLLAFSGTSICREDMFKAMNRLLLLKGDKEDYSTMDVAEIDLRSGVLYWTKIGAVPGYILRNGKVEKIETGGLPLGILAKINPVTTKKLVQNGDVIVLVSDGVYDGLCVGENDKISDVLLSSGEKSEKELCEQLLSQAEQSENDDDMTVMVLKVNAA